METMPEDSRIYGVVALKTPRLRITVPIYLSIYLSIYGSIFIIFSVRMLLFFSVQILLARRI
jgi:hypothetical protein